MANGLAKGGLRVPAVVSTLSAHFGAESAMLVLMLLALFGALRACENAGLQHGLQYLFILARPPDRDFGRCVADVRAIAATPDALPHVGFLGGARVGA